MKVHKNQWFLTAPSPPATPCGATNQGTHPRAGAQAPPQGPERGRSPEPSSCNHLKTKHFHVALAGNKHPHLLKSRYGKVSQLAHPRPCHVVLFSSDLALAYEPLVNYYSLRFQIEFNFHVGESETAP